MDRFNPSLSSGVTFSRLKIVAGGVFFLFMLVCLRLCWVSLKSTSRGESLTAQEVRASITDRHGQVIASSLITFSVYAHPQKIQNKGQTVKELCELFPSLYPKTLLKLLSSDKPFVWIIRHISPEKKMAVLSLGIEGIEIKKDYKRIYPHDRLFSHVVGMTDVDQQGISGLEKSLNKQLLSSHKPVQTSLDLRLQHIVYYQLKKQMQEFQAEAGNALLADIHTGEILAMVSLPDFSPSTGKTETINGVFNRNVNGVYEFGSIMKIVNTALLLESGKGTLSSVFDASHPFFIGRFPVKDFKGKNRPLTVYEAFIYSSNIAQAKMALACGAALQKQFFQKIGFMSRLTTELMDSARPLMPDKKWPPSSVATLGYGYGFAVTPLHALSAIRSIVAGYYTPLTLMAFPVVSKTPIVSQKTAKIITYLLGEAVKKGLVSKAAAKSCEVGAKTGTANLLSKNKRYCQQENLTSCVGIFPLDDPRYILLVSIERAKPNAKTHGYATAGWFAAPLIAHIVDEIAPLLGLIQAPVNEAPLVPQAIDQVIQSIP